MNAFMVCQRLLLTETDCALFAQTFARALDRALHQLPSSWKVYLQGDLGVGKTSFVRHLLRSLGVNERIKSPSFALMYSYPLALGIEAHHFDFYRLSAADQWLGVGLEAHFDHPRDLLLVEWPDKASLPPWDVLLAWQWHSAEASVHGDDESLAARSLSLHVRSDFAGRDALVEAFADDALTGSPKSGT